MKNQNDLILWIVSGVLTIIGVVLCFTVFKREPAAVTPPQPVVVSAAQLPAEAPVLTSALPQGSGGDAGGGMMGAAGRGMPSFGGGAGRGRMGMPGGVPGAMGGPKAAGGAGGGADKPSIAANSGAG